MKKGFIFIETIVVVSVLTVALMSLYTNYSKIISNTKELNTFDTTEYNYKTYFLKDKYINGTNIVDAYGTTITSFNSNTCIVINSNFSDNNLVKICKLEGTSGTNYIKDNKAKFDAYIIDYLLNQDLTPKNDNIFLVEYKKNDKMNSEEYFTYISSLNY